MCGNPDEGVVSGGRAKNRVAGNFYFCLGSSRSSLCCKCYKRLDGLATTCCEI